MNGDTGQPAIDTEVNIVPHALSHDAVVATMHTDGLARLISPASRRVLHPFNLF